MVHPYLRRRQGLEPVNYPSKELEAVLGKTLGVPLFQEQAMKIAIVAAGFTPAEADRLRRAMATFKRAGTIGKFRTKMIEGMVARNYSARFRRALLQADRRLRHLWLSRKPCGLLRAARLCLGLDEMPLSRRLRLRALECPADGFLCAGADRPRRARTWHRDRRGRCEFFTMGCDAGRGCNGMYVPFRSPTLGSTQSVRLEGRRRHIPMVSIRIINDGHARDGSLTSA